RFIRGRLNRLTISRANSRNLPSFHWFPLQRRNCKLPTKAISSRRFSNAQLTGRKNTSWLGIFFRSCYRNDSNHRSAVHRSISIAAFVLSILLRICFVSTSGVIFHSSAVHPRCTFG